MNRLNVLYLFFFVFTLLLASISQNRNLIGFFFMIILAAVPFWIEKDLWLTCLIGTKRYIL